MIYHCYIRWVSVYSATSQSNVYPSGLISSSIFRLEDDVIQALTSKGMRACVCLCVPTACVQMFVYMCVNQVLCLCEILQLIQTEAIWIWANSSVSSASYLPFEFDEMMLFCTIKLDN